jgi:hypothetical protein
VSRRAGPRSVLTPAGDPREDQSRVDRRAGVGADAQTLAGAGPKAVQQHVGVGNKVQQLLRIGFDVQIHDPLAPVQQVKVLGGHRQSTWTTDPDHVGTQVREHHCRVRARTDAAEFDHSHPVQGSAGGQGDSLPHLN